MTTYITPQGVKSSRAPSQKIVAPTLVQAIATITLALVNHKVVDPATFALAAGTLTTAMLGYLVPHKPVPKPPHPHPHPKPPVPPSRGFVTIFDGTSADVVRNTRVVASSRDALAGYDDGLYNDVGQMRKDFPGHHVFSIAVFETDGADFADCEKGNMTPAQAVDWAMARHRQGVKFIGLYADKSDWETIDTIMHSRGISTRPRKDGGPICRWVADPTGDYAHIPPGFDGCQWRWRAGYDESLFYGSSLI